MTSLQSSRDSMQISFAQGGGELFIILSGDTSVEVWELHARTLLSSTGKLDGKSIGLAGFGGRREMGRNVT